MNIKTLTVPFITVCLIAISQFSTGNIQASPSQQAVAITNGGFESPYKDGNANGWGPWHQDTGKKECGTSLVRPSWWGEQNAGLNLIHGGSGSQGVGNQFDTWRAGVLQSVNVTQGKTYKFSVWGRVRSSNEDFPAPSDGQAGWFRAGIDPGGSGNWGNAQWGTSTSAHDSWAQVSFQVKATSNKITLFTEARFDNSSGYCSKHLDAWFDDAELVEVNAAPPPPPTKPPQPGPWPTNTPQPGQQPPPPPAPTTVAQQVFVTPGPTPTPDGDGLIWFAVPPGGSMWSVASYAGITVDELAALNNLPANAFVQAGQLLVVAQTAPGVQLTFTPEAAPADDGDGVPEATATTAPPTPTPLPPITGGVICVNAFGDTNGNGGHEPTEGFMAGVTFRLVQNGAVLSQGLSRGTDEAVCFENIPAGPYVIEEQLPSSLEPTTAMELALDLVEGQPLGLEFGSRLKPDDAGKPQAESVADAGSQDEGDTNPSPAADTSNNPASPLPGFSLAAISGLILLVVAILLLGGLILLVTRQR